MNTTTTENAPTWQERIAAEVEGWIEAGAAPAEELARLDAAHARAGGEGMKPSEMITEMVRLRAENARRQAEVERVTADVERKEAEQAEAARRAAEDAERRQREARERAEAAVERSNQEAKAQAIAALLAEQAAADAKKAQAEADTARYGGRVRATVHAFTQAKRITEADGAAILATLKGEGFTAAEAALTRALNGG